MLGKRVSDHVLGLLQIPFEVSKQNLKNLEHLFDPSLGMLMRGTDLVQWVYKLLP